MHNLSKLLFQSINGAFAEANSMHRSGEMTTEEFYQIKQVFASAKKHLLPSKSKAMNDIEKDLQKKYSKEYLESCSKKALSRIHSVIL